MIAIVFIFCWISTQCQEVFREDFEQYNVPGTTPIDIQFNGGWYDKILQQNTTYQIRYNSNYQTNTMDTISNTSPSELCYNISNLMTNSVYQIQLDSIISSFISTYINIFDAKWNDVVVFSFVFAQNDLSEQFSFTVITNSSDNIFCFYVNASFSYIATGPQVDNITINFVRQLFMNTSVTEPIVTPQKAQTTLNETITDPTLQNDNQEQNKTAENSQNQSYIKISMVIKQVINWIEFVGFGYLITNLLNFWNLIVLYYFLGLAQQPETHRRSLENICLSAMTDGSLLSMISSIFNVTIQVQVPEYVQQRIKSAQKSWKSYNEAQISSNVIQNGFESYTVLAYSLFKIGLIYLLKLLPIPKIKDLMLRIKVKHLMMMLLFEIIANTHTLTFPFFILILKQNNFYSLNFYDKINAIFIILTVFTCILAILMYSYLQAEQSSNLIASKKKRFYGPKQQKQHIEKIPEPRKNHQTLCQEQNRIQHIQSHKRLTPNKQYSRKSTLSFESIHLIHFKKINCKRSYFKQQVNSQINSLIAKTKEQRLRRQIYYEKKKKIFGLSDNLLYLLIPAILQMNYYAFFSVILFYLCADVLLMIRYHQCFYLKDKVFRFLVKSVWIIITLVYMQFFLQEEGYVEYSQQILEILGSTSIILILFGGLLELIHTLISFITCFIKTLLMLCRKDNRITVENTQKRQINPIFLQMQEKNMFKGPSKIFPQNKIKEIALNNNKEINYWSKI